MSTNSSLEFNGKYIHVIHPPDYEITPESQDKLWTELSIACRKFNCLKVLIEGTAAKRRMSSMDAFESGSQASQAIPGLAMAICFQEYAPDETTRFFTNVSFNRGARVEFFNDKKKALDWLGIKGTE